MKRLLMWLSIIALTACGGSGGGSTPTPTPPTTYSISGTTVAGATVSLSKTTPSTTVSTTADASGNYVFAGIGNGSYTVAPSLTGNTFSPASMSVTINSANVPGINFTATAVPPSTYSISGTVTGGTSSGVTITLSPGGTTTVTAANGTYSFTGVLNGGYTVTPSPVANPAFTPANQSVTVNGANVTGVNFTTPVPTLAVGKLLYPCQMAVCTKDLSTGVESVVYGSPNWYPDTIVPYRAQQSIAVMGSNVGVIFGFSIAQPHTSAGAAGNGWFMSPTDCYSWPNDWPAVGFDLSPLGDFAVFSSNCTPPGLPARTDIFLMLMDGSNSWARVTDDVDADSQPVIGGVDAMTGYVTSLWIRNGTEIRKQIVDPVPNPTVLVGPQTIVATSVMKGVRSMSVNSTYTHLAFMKNVGGVSHITVVPLAGGAEVDLGVGTDPYWSLDGSNLILYTASSALWAMNPNGTGKMSVPIPSNLQYGLGKVVFGPAGY